MFAMEEKDIQKTNSSEQKSEQAIKTNDVSQIDMTNFIEIDRLKLFFGDPIIINDKITLYQPTVGDIVEFGEKKFYSILYTLTCIPSDMKSELWDANHTDWQTVDDFELFITMTRMLTSEDTKLFLGDLDLSKMIPCSRQDNGQLVLYDEKHDILIDKLIYLKIVTYIREMFNIYPKVEKAKNKKTFQVMIDFDRMQKLNQRKNKDCNASMLLPLISSMLNSPGFKYKKNGKRRFRRAYIEIPRKNAKTFFCSLLAIYLCICDNENAARIYIAANSLDQANEAWSHCKNLVDNNEELKKHFRLLVASIEYDRTKSFIRKVASDSKNIHGKNISRAICDELHVWNHRDLWDVIFRSTASRRNPLMVGITTAGTNQQGTGCSG